jgi:hypothetical protein
MKFSTDSFVASIVAIVVAIVIFAAVAVPVVTDAVADIPESEGMLKTIMTVIPVFMAIGILMACIYLFISKKA